MSKRDDDRPSPVSAPPAGPRPAPPAGARPAQWPDDEPLPSEEELQAAAALAAGVDGWLASAEEPPGRDEDMAELLASVGQVHASHHPEELPRPRRDAIFDEALREVDERQQSRQRIRLVPLLALAAAMLLAVGGVFYLLPQGPTPGPAAPRVVRVERPPLPATMRSRPSNDLIGRPIQDRGALASQRIDRVFASRLAGYRALRHARWARARARRTP